MAISNAAYEQAFLKKYPQYKSYTAGGTASLFKSEGFLDCILSDITKLNEVYNALNRITLNIINIAQVSDSFDIGDFGETFDSEYAAGVQRMAIFPMKPTSPKYRNIPKAGVNQQQVRIPKIEDRYFKVNFDFQNFYTLQEFQIKQMFVSEYGISEFYAGFMAQMGNSYTEQKHLSVLECINALIHSEKHPLQTTQKEILTEWTDNAPTSAQLKELIQRVKFIVSRMKATTSTGAFNATGFKTKQDVSRLRLLCRVGLKDLIETEVLAPIFHDEKLSLPFEIIEVENFGGLTPTAEADDEFTGDGTETTFELSATYHDTAVVTVGGTATTAYKVEDNSIVFDSAPANNSAIVVTYHAELYPVYATAANTDRSVGEGEMIGYSLTEGAVSATYEEDADEVIMYDPNSNILAILADKGLVFQVIHNAPRMIAAPYNAAGLYVTNWFSAPGNEIHGDALYTMVTFEKPVE